MKAGKILLCGASFALAISMATPTFAATGSRHITNDMVQNGMLKNTENFGGGVWDYGTCLAGVQKKCWSNYLQYEKKHSSTASINTHSNTSVAEAGSTSYASVLGALDGTTHVRWNDEPDK